MTTPTPGWQPDPTGRHEHRYWDGTQWTDDVSDRGATSVDPLSGAPSTPGVQATPPTAGYGQPPVAPGYGQPGYGQAGPVDPTNPYGQPSTPYEQHAGAYGIDPYAPAPGAPPSGSGPSTGLLVGLGVLLLVLVVGIAVIVTSGGDDDNDGDAETAGNTEAAVDDDGSDDGGGGSSGGVTTIPTTDPSGGVGDLSDIPGGEDAIAAAMADGLVSASQGILTDEEGTCLASGMIDAVGLDRLIEAGTQVGQGGAPFDVYTSEELGAISQVMLDCVPADKIDDLAPVFGDFVEDVQGG